MSISRFDALRGVTRRALWIFYKSPMICELAEVLSGSGSGDVSLLDILPVTRKAGTVLTITAQGATELRLTWESIPDAYSYVVYRATVDAGPYSIVASGIQALFYVDTPPAAGTFSYKVTGIEPDFGETEASNIVSGSV